MRALLRVLALFSSAVLLTAQPGVLTYHNDIARTGQQLNETALTPTTVNPSGFGELFSYPVDGYVYAQPLYVQGVTIPGKGTHNAVYVATEHDSVYAFDADSNSGSNAMPLWHVSFLSSGVTTVPAGDTSCSQITPEIGITATPVIDSASGTIYVVAMTKEGAGAPFSYVQRLHALDITNGAERSGSPVVVQASVAGTGDGGSTVTFDPKSYKSRPGLLLLNGIVYTSWSSHCDIGTYHGWIIGYHTLNLSQTPVIYNTTPNGQQASLWASGAGPAVDTGGNIYINTGNGTFDTNHDYGDSFVKLSTAGGGLSVADYFTPLNQASLSSADEDLGSGGVLVVPDGLGGTTHPNLLAGAGKEGKIYLVDRGGMGQFNSGADNVVQSLPGAIGSSFGMPAFFNNTLYYGGSGDSLKAFSFSGGLLSTSPTSKTAATFGFPGITPSVSANGSSNGIVWGIEGAGSQAVLHAFAANDLSQELYSSAKTGGRDNAGGYVKFSVPTIANGKVYAGGQATLTVFGILGPPPPPPAATPTFNPPGGSYSSTQSVTIKDTTLGAIIHYTTNGSTPTASSPVFTTPLSISSTTTVKAIATASGYSNSAVASATYTIRHHGHH
ncbi:MAG TPA: chitobiase/beta-hexosaminidase C-terminal domain-containing protein [Bryobacterales bacterium]|nr:chitobiase/beta-hexosaminidase C-terminal domain-containing protein [Bryobacterales bacterium]